MRPYIDRAEFRQIADKALGEAIAALKDEGITLSIDCDYSNGNPPEVQEFVKRIESGEYTDEDMARLDYIASALED